MECSGRDYFDSRRATATHHDRKPTLGDSALRRLVQQVRSALERHSRAARQTKPSTALWSAFDEYKKGKAVA